MKSTRGVPRPEDVLLELERQDDDVFAAFDELREQVEERIAQVPRTNGLRQRSADD